MIMENLHTGKRAGTRFNIFGVLVFILAFQSGGCTIISVEGSLLTEDKSDRITGFKGIFEAVKLPKERDSKNINTPVSSRSQ